MESEQAPLDMTGNGCADVIGFRDTQVVVSLNDGKGGFPSRTLLSTFGYNNGQWSVD
jgi:hypothetical protein